RSPPSTCPATAASSARCSRPPPRTCRCGGGRTPPSAAPAEAFRLSPGGGGAQPGHPPAPPVRARRAAGGAPPEGRASRGGAGAGQGRGGGAGHGGAAVAAGPGDRGRVGAGAGGAGGGVVLRRVRAVPEGPAARPRLRLPHAQPPAAARPGQRAAVVRLRAVVQGLFLG